MGGARGACGCSDRGRFALSRGARPARRPHRARGGVGPACGLRGQGGGATDAAARELRSALTELERPGRSLVLAERRSAFLADKWDVYAQLALVERDRGRVGAAFEASERLRAREMLELLARGRVSAPPDTSQDLVARE